MKSVYSITFKQESRRQNRLKSLSWKKSCQVLTVITFQRGALTPLAPALVKGAADSALRVLVKERSLPCQVWAARKQRREPPSLCVSFQVMETSSTDWMMPTVEGRPLLD